MSPWSSLLLDFEVRKSCRNFVASITLVEKSLVKVAKNIFHTENKNIFSSPIENF